MTLTKSFPYNYRCPNFVCKAEYVAVRREAAPLYEPRCIECGMAFLSKTRADTSATRQLGRSPSCRQITPFRRFERERFLPKGASRS